MDSLKNKAMHYTSAENISAHVLADEVSRQIKARKIQKVLEEEGVFPDHAITLLDVGCSRGLILKNLMWGTRFCVGIDMDQHVSALEGENVAFVRGNAEELPFASSCFDVVICNQVYEHTENPECLMKEIWRIMKPRGTCYFAGPNKYSIIEPHYGLPFLSWFPKSVADLCVRLTGRGRSYPERPYSYSGLLSLLGDFDIRDYTGPVVIDPLRFHASDELRPGSLKWRIANMVFRLCPFLMPGYIFVLRKKYV